MCLSCNKIYDELPVFMWSEIRRGLIRVGVVLKDNLQLSMHCKKQKAQSGSLAMDDGGCTYPSVQCQALSIDSVGKIDRVKGCCDD
jgi:hypothetical protein